MFDVTFVMAFLLDQRQQPSTGICSRLNVLVLAGHPHVLHDPSIICDPTHDDVNSRVGELRSDFLGTGCELDKRLHEQFDHRIHAWSKRVCEILDQDT